MDFVSEVQNNRTQAVYAWAVEGNIDAHAMVCDTIVQIEWPPKQASRFLFLKLIKENGLMQMLQNKRSIHRRQTLLMN